MTATGTGCLMTRGDTDWIVFTRTIGTPNDPERMARWIGIWSGDPATGR